ncbi:MAG: MBL fold metallo-hydrolase [Limnobacter sp.]|uniref:MBL fold metallo-hydrolase n=1 Tax=Limnobacter sp. TaxID=2003368 RepID=UPI0022BCA621|nr:MBL fold metallo-hydrolase [Limnobacter sp.]MCZ8016684.1 MBL fold metallo-hydrolase [Limnobacter sp.]
MTIRSFFSTALLVALVPLSVQAQNLVKVTPLGGQAGEFCRFDRALVFEDPNGTRILYDAGRTVAGADDPRLGKIDVVLVSHMHGDHLGDRHNPVPNAGSCDKPDISVSALPNSSSVNIAVKTGAKIVTGSEMPSFLANKLKLAGGDEKNSMLVRFGGMQTIGGVGITTVPAAHSNGISGDFVGQRLGELMKEAGVTAEAGPATGYVLKFSNGLVVYLSGDTGITSEQKDVVGKYYKPQLAVINIGDTFTTGPREAAYVINELVEPKAVIASHANEVATQNGKVIAGTKTEQFIKATNVPVHVPLSGKTMSFDSKGKCAAGC